MVSHGDVTEAVKRDLAEIAKRDRALAESSLAATALALARELDARNSATSKSMCAKALNETMAMIRELAPAKQERDALDEIAERRSRRRAAASK